MYQAFSKGFGKAGSDLLKKDFKDKFDHKLTTKAKAADGTTFEANVSDQKNMDGSHAADFAVTVPVDSGLKVTVKTETNEANKSVKVDYTVDANFNANATFLNPCMGDNMPGTIEVGANYATKEFSAEVEAQIMKAGKQDAGLVLGLAAPVPMVDGLSIGVRPTFYKPADDIKSNVLMNVAYDQKDYGLSVNTFWTNAIGDKFAYSGLDIVGRASVNADCSVAAKFSQFDAQPAGFPAKAFAAAEQKKKFEVAVGTQYKLSKTQTAKAKFTYGEKPNKEKTTMVKSMTTSLALKTALEGKSNLTLSMDLAAGAPAFGVAYSLE